MMVQTKEELELWYIDPDPWGYENHPDDANRRSILLSEIPKRDYRSVLDIGCGNGFITRELPGEKVVGVDISSSAIEFAKAKGGGRCNFAVGSIFDLVKFFPNVSFDLIVITGVLYEQYIGNSLDLIYLLVDKLLASNGILAAVHIDKWYRGRFPYLLTSSHIYEYREFLHRLEIYIK